MADTPTRIPAPFLPGAHGRLAYVALSELDPLMQFADEDDLDPIMVAAIEAGGATVMRYDEADCTLTTEGVPTHAEDARALMAHHRRNPRPQQLPYHVATDVDGA